MRRILEVTEALRLLNGGPVVVSTSSEGNEVQVQDYAARGVMVAWYTKVVPNKAAARAAAIKLYREQRKAEEDNPKGRARGKVAEGAVVLRM